MGMVCLVCSNENRKQIDRDLVLGKTLREISGRYGLSKSGVHRHRECIADSMDALRERVQATSGLTAKSVMLDLVNDLRTMAAACNTEKREAMFLAVADRLTRACESYGRLNREMPVASVEQFFVSVGVSSESEVRSALQIAKSGEAASIDDLLEEWVETTRFLLHECPERAQAALAALGNRSEVVPAMIEQGSPAPQITNGGPK